MSITTLSSDHTADKIIYNNKKSFHHRNDSADELDVFEAARYFSGYNNEAAAGYHCGSTYNNSQKMREDHHRQAWRGGRVSLDLPMIREPVVLAHHQHQHQEKQLMNNNIKEKKCKQPSSPGGRLASFLNSLFNQSSSKKKKSKSMKDIHEEESPGGGRRKRRSSISHFRSSSNTTTTTTTTTTDSKSLYSSSSSGFRTPPPYAHTPTKSYKDFRSYSDHHKLLKQVVKPAAAVSAVQNENINKDLSWLDEKFKIIDAYSSDQKHKYSSHEEKDYRSSKLINENITIIDDGAESDSSSDLFELQNYDLGIYSNGLPVYETTHMDNIKRSGAPISNGAL
ncbi:hypothetical protein Ddye_030808 [Dipteronia dyeriana]|uniref:Protein BIG GRAIN 1-like E n=1 Tax=Dipteronia dyeriana TaxID=168575 RepID=A0AAD9WLX6_9ROSI|nr:hypothetical protein Ddye_030808 [Dipteronia dyeriana]